MRLFKIPFLKQAKTFLRLQICFVSVVACFSSCGSFNHKLDRIRTEVGYCDPPIIYSYDSAARPLPDISQLIDSNLVKKYSQHSLLAANASGVLQALKDLQVLQVQSIEYLAKRQQIILRLLLVSTEIASISAELDCEGERARQVADFIQQKENKRVKTFTIVSITIGAIAGIASSVAHSHTGAETVAIVGGVTGAGLGLTALFSAHRILFDHPRNLLTDIWLQPASSSLYPPPVWYMLTEKHFSNSQESAIAHNLKERWIKFETLNRHDKQMEKLFFGTGGSYNADELRSRERMLNQVQAAVRLMDQDLQGLIGELSR